MVKEFSKEAIDNLKYYVYKLIDPRDGKVFYIGKGKGNRVFSHINLSLRYESRDEEISDKISLIREIKNDGLDVITIIHRHGINDEDTAYQVEAALIDEYNNLTNIQGGHNSNDYGPINVNQVENIYGLEKLTIDDIDKSDKLLLIKIREENIKNNNNDIYSTVRYAWSLNKNRVNDIKMVAAVVNGVIRKVYRVDRWYYVPERDRYAFEGTEIESKYLNKRIPDEYRKKGMASPTIYTF